MESGDAHWLARRSDGCRAALCCLRGKLDVLIRYASLIGDDLITGAGPIAAFLFGSRSEKRKGFHLVEKGELPPFRLGSTICARKAVIIRWDEEEEQRTISPQHPLRYRMYPSVSSDVSVAIFRKIDVI